ncbi:MAG: type VI secretion system contractile sheath small subunit [Myxococcota bacterium]
MAKEGSVAPKERINIVYKPATNMDEEIELPFKMLVVGDFTGRADDTALEDRSRINIDKDNFNQVLAEQKINISMGVDDKLSPDAEDGDQLAVDLSIDNMKSFEPEQIVQQVPELRSLLEIREALVALKGPLGNVKSFSKKLKEVLGDDAARERLVAELTQGDGSGDSGGGGAEAPAPEGGDSGEPTE